MTDPGTPPCIVALDYADSESMFQFLDQVSPATIPWVKIGLQMFCNYGPSLVEKVGARGYNVFLDLKLHDIPNTVAGAIQSLSNLPIGMLTLHASGGQEMMTRAVEAQKKYAPELKLLAVTVLTSMNSHQLAETGIAESAEDQVIRLVGLAAESGIPGIVCSPNEIAAIRDQFANGPYLVTPGIRPSGAEMGDQKRAMTPGQAAQLGANALVVGRPITQAKDPVGTYAAIIAEMGDALGSTPVA